MSSERCALSKIGMAMGIWSTVRPEKDGTDTDHNDRFCGLKLKLKLELILELKLKLEFDRNSNSKPESAENSETTAALPNKHSSRTRSFSDLRRTLHLRWHDMAVLNRQRQGFITNCPKEQEPSKMRSSP
mmetsp:Transcript_19134/g.53273  ORF Transcript_19134/g.53273 Transcript_19134/m.53273 type:complete len:130 (-) Transcript_19134:911-1300(-)